MDGWMAGPALSFLIQGVRTRRGMSASYHHNHIEHTPAYDSEGLPEPYVDDTLRPANNNASGAGK
jgi:hypothetical protein